MNIIIKGNHIEINEAINGYVSKRLETIEKFLEDNAKIEVEVSKTTNHHKQGDIFRAEMNINNNGDETRAEAEASDLYAAIDQLRDETSQILSSKKGKKESQWKDGKMKIKDMMHGEDGAALAADADGEVPEVYADSQ